MFFRRLLKKIFRRPIISYLILLGLFNVSVQAQHSSYRQASFMFYGQYIQPFVELQHGYFYKGELDSFAVDFFVKVSFRIDTAGKVIELKLLTDSIPPSVALYAKRMVLITSGKWVPEVSNCEETVSQDIICGIMLRTKKLSLVERLKKMDAENEAYLFGNKPMPPNPIDEFFSKPNRCYVSLEY